LIEDFRIGPISISKDVPKDSLEYKALERFIKKMEQRGEIETAKGRKKQVKIAADAEAERIATVTAAWKDAGDLGVFLRTQEAMEKTTAAFQYNIHDIPQLKDLLGRLNVKFGENDMITREELSELISLLRNTDKAKKD